MFLIRTHMHLLAIEFIFEMYNISQMLTKLGNKSVKVNTP